ncbi:MAG: hypothetical protein GC205_12510 [Bacteroidetes bacterium]|nr:hypothetical protein [Bacteroidota bacterium]
MQRSNFDTIFFRCMIPLAYWRTTAYACQLPANQKTETKPSSNSEKSGVKPAIPSFKIMNMNFSRTSLYAAAFVMGCLSLNNMATAQVRVVGEAPGGSSAPSTSRPTYLSSASPGGSGSTGTSRPHYYSSTTPGGSSSTGTSRPPYYGTEVPGSSGGSSFSRPGYVSSAAPVVGQQNPSLQIGVYPNPATEILYVEISGLRSDESVHINLFNERGTRFSVPMVRGGESVRIEVGNLPRGGYRIQVITNSSEVIRNIELI